MTLPLLKTKILSRLYKLLNFSWEKAKINVLPINKGFYCFSIEKFFKKACSVKGSRLLVASSNKKIFAFFFNKARAMSINCLSSAERLTESSLLNKKFV